MLFLSYTFFFTIFLIIIIIIVEYATESDQKQREMRAESAKRKIDRTQVSTLKIYYKIKVEDLTS